MTSPDISTDGLLTDLYQFTMIQGYLEHDLQESATFEFFVRKLPRQRNFLVAAGLEQFLEFVADIRFSQADIEWLAKRGFGAKLLNFLSNFRFTGDVHAMPEGTIFFPDEPILRVTARLPQAQLLETRAINLLHFQSVIASKAVRMLLAAPGKRLVDFGLRRAHGAEAGLLAARACYAVGFAGTATVLAGQRFGVPLFGTMAHSFIEAHDDELTAFEHFATANPNDAALLLDTYDTEAAAHKVVALAKKLSPRGIQIQAVRLDSGDLNAHARRVRAILDEGGLRDVRILASGGLDEFQLAELVGQQAPIDGFGIGTRLDVSSDAPYLDCAYKLVEYAGKPRRKRSEGKAVWPGRKQVYRYFGANGQMDHDVITLDDDSMTDGEPQLIQALRQGCPVGPLPTLDQIRARVAAQSAKLPPPWKSLEPSPEFRVEISAQLRNLAKEWINVDNGLQAMQLAAAARLAKELMSKHGLLPKWQFAFDRAVVRFGCCNWRDRKITLSEKLVAINDEAAVRDTVLHEIAHALTSPRCGHGPKWKRIAQSIGANAQRCYGDEVVQAPYRYVGTCPTCRRTVRRNRRARVSCAHCDRAFNPKHLFRWHRTSGGA